jgi:hypothetical protein
MSHKYFTNENSIQSEENGHLILGIQQNATTNNSPIGNGSLLAFQFMLPSGKPTALSTVA